MVRLPFPGYGADGTDSAEHTLEYAIRVPSGLSSPSTGLPQRESRAYHTPLVATVGSSSAASPTSLITITNQSGQASPAYAMAGKRGAFVPSNAVFRVANPTNAPVRAPALYVPCLSPVHAS